MKNATAMKCWEFVFLDKPHNLCSVKIEICIHTTANLLETCKSRIRGGCAYTSPVNKSDAAAAADEENEYKMMVRSFGTYWDVLEVIMNLDNNIILCK